MTDARTGDGPGHADDPGSDGPGHADDPGSGGVGHTDDPGSGGAPENGGRRGLRAYHLLALLPPLGMLGGIPFANRTEPYVLGLPFLLFWILAWVVGTSAVLAVIYGLDSRRAARGEPLP